MTELIIKVAILKPRVMLTKETMC